MIEVVGASLYGLNCLCQGFGVGLSIFLFKWLSFYIEDNWCRDRDIPKRGFRICTELETIPVDARRHYGRSWMRFLPFCMGLLRYVNGVHLSAVLGNTALVQEIRCEPLGKHLIPWTCAVFFYTARK